MNKKISNTGKKNLNGVQHKPNLNKKKKLIIWISAIVSIIAVVLGILLVLSIRDGNKIITYNIIFNTDGGSKIDNQVVIKGNKIVKPESPTKEGYIFSGWTMNGKPYDFSIEVSKDAELKANWISEDETTYVVKFDSKGGNSIDEQIIKDGEKVLEPSKPTKKGYKFINWTLDGKEYNFDSEVTSDLTLIAEWKEVAEDKKENNTTNSQNPNSSTNPSVDTNKNNDTNNTSSTNQPLLSVSSKEVNIKYGEKKDIVITFNSNEGNISREIGNSDIVSTKWGKWEGKSIKLTIIAEEAGQTDIVISNTVNSEKVTIKVVVDGPWKDVKVVIPETIGDDLDPENRIKVLKYNFVSFTDSNYQMYVSFKLVQFKSTKRTSWSGDVYFYDAAGNVLDDHMLYASNVTLNGEYLDDMRVPMNTAKIVFVEYPDPNAGKEEVDPKKWTSADATNLNNYLNQATNYANDAVSHANKAYSAGASSSTYLTYAKNNLGYALRQLNKAKELAESKATLTTTNNSTLLNEINNAIASCNQYEQLVIDTNNINTSQQEIANYASNASIKIIAAYTLSTKLLAEFV